MCWTVGVNKQRGSRCADFLFLCVYPKGLVLGWTLFVFWNDVAFAVNVIYIWFYTPHRISRGHSCRVDWGVCNNYTEYNFKLPIEMNTTNPTTTITWNDDKRTHSHSHSHSIDVQSHLEIYHPWKAIPSSKLSDQHISPPSWFAELVWPYLYFYKTNILYKLYPFGWISKNDKLSMFIHPVRFRLLVRFQMWTRKGSVNSELTQIIRK